MAAQAITHRGPTRDDGDPPIAGELQAEQARSLAMQARALADPTRLRIVDVLRETAPRALCQCELTPLFEISQQALSKHLRLLTGAGVIASERRGVWTFYSHDPGGLEEIRSWLA
jgi:ArsR family transcriptional regulator, arsenate/arsenite/antimonite-responsive transcriptional repressor